MEQIIRNIPILTICIIAFLILLNLQFRKSNRKQQNVEEAFWERENLANATRKQDISNLPYITIPKEIIPSNLGTDAEKELLGLSEVQILNLTGYTNTDLKMEYGVANLEFLSACDEHFTELVTALCDYSKDLIDRNMEKDALALLEFAVSVQADAKPIYIRLAKLYQEAGTSEKIDGLITAAEELKSLSKNSIIADLKSLRAS